MNNIQISKEYSVFLEDLKTKVTSARYRTALSVNKELILLYHHIGRGILESQAKHGWGS
jgi:hypothetical protein